MRKIINKYTIFGKTGKFLKKYPLKLTRFKRPKWFVFKKQITKVKSKEKLHNFLKIKRNYRVWEKKKRYKKSAGMLKNALSCIFSNSVNHKSVKKEISKYKKRHLFLNFCLNKTFFRVDVLLFHLNFCHSAQEAKEFIYAKKIKVNGQVLKSYKKFLKLGDIVSVVPYSNTTFKKISLKYKSSKNFLAFVEVDRYSNSFTIIKNFNQLGGKEIGISRSEYLDSMMYLSSL